MKFRKKTFDFLHAFFGNFGSGGTKPHETRRNHYETSTKPLRNQTKKDRYNVKKLRNRERRACGYIIFNTASADFVVS